MRTLIDPVQLGLSLKTEIYQVSKNTFEIIKDRKSRIIMKDGKQILSIANSLQKEYPVKSIIVRTNAPVCSKTKQFLAENNITIACLEK